MTTYELKFDIYALARPQRPCDIDALAHELIREIDEFNALWDAMTSRIEAKLRAAA